MYRQFVLVLVLVISLSASLSASVSASLSVRISLSSMQTSRCARPLLVKSSRRFAPAVAVSSLQSTRTFVSSSSSSSPLLPRSAMSVALHAKSQQSQHQQQQNRDASYSTVGKDVDAAMQALAVSDCVCFDVDSTVVNEEGIDVLADYLGQGQAVAALTLQAMEGGMKFQDALAARLDLLKPAKQQIEQCLVDKPLQLTAGIQELVSKLHAAGKDVYLVSGGFRIMIEPVAAILGIDKSRIVANTILFDQAGKYDGFDPMEPTSRDMGKPAALKQIQLQGGYKTMVMVGDGATDMQAKPPATAFIGFGGVAIRKQVQDSADWFVTDFQDMIRVVDGSN